MMANQFIADKYDKNWAWTNYLSNRALMQAENVRTQLERIMERHEVALISTQDERKLVSRKVAGNFLHTALPGLDSILKWRKCPFFVVRGQIPFE